MTASSNFSRHLPRTEVVCFLEKLSEDIIIQEAGQWAGPCEQHVVEGLRG